MCTRSRIIQCYSLSMQLSHRVAQAASVSLHFLVSQRKCPLKPEEENKPISVPKLTPRKRAAPIRPSAAAAAAAIAKPSPLQRLSTIDDAASLATRPAVPPPMRRVHSDPLTSTNDLTCDKCGESFTAHSSLVRHASVHPPPRYTGQVISCRGCGAEFCFGQRAAKHVSLCRQLYSEAERCSALVLHTRSNEQLQAESANESSAEPMQQSAAESGAEEETRSLHPDQLSDDDAASKHESEVKSPDWPAAKKPRLSNADAASEADAARALSQFAESSPDTVRTGDESSKDDAASQSSRAPKSASPSSLATLAALSPSVQPMLSSSALIERDALSAASSMEMPSTIVRAKLVNPSVFSPPLPDVMPAKRSSATPAHNNNISPSKLLPRQCPHCDRAWQAISEGNLQRHASACAAARSANKPHRVRIRKKRVAGVPQLSASLVPSTEPAVTATPVSESSSAAVLPTPLVATIVPPSLSAPSTPSVAPARPALEFRRDRRGSMDVQPPSSPKPFKAKVATSAHAPLSVSASAATAASSAAAAAAAAALPWFAQSQLELMSQMAFAPSALLSFMPTLPMHAPVLQSAPTAPQQLTQQLTQPQQQQQQSSLSPQSKPVQPKQAASSELSSM